MVCHSCNNTNTTRTVTCARCHKETHKCRCAKIDSRPATQSHKNICLHHHASKARRREPQETRTKQKPTRALHATSLLTPRRSNHNEPEVRRKLHVQARCGMGLVQELQMQFRIMQHLTSHAESVPTASEACWNRTANAGRPIRQVDRNKPITSVIRHEVRRRLF